MHNPNNLAAFQNPSLKRILGYLAGFAPMVLLIGVFNIAYIDFFSDNLKLDDTLLIIGLVIYGIVNALNDPFIGHTQDNTNFKKWGSRRIVYIKYVCPFLIIVFILMWFPWHESNQTIMFLHFVVSICLFDTLLNIVTMAWMALLPDMTADVDQRARINFFGAIISLFTGLCVMVVPTIINDRALFQKFNVGVGILALVCYLLVVALSKESPEFQADKSPPLWPSIKQTIKLKSFSMYIGWMFTKSFAGSMFISYLFVFLLILGKDNLVFFFAIIVVVGYSSNIICLKLRPKYGVKRLMLSFGLLRSIGGFGTFFLIIIPGMDYIVWPGLIWITFFGGAEILGTILQTLPIDEDEVKHGSRREGMFYGVNALFTKPADSLGPIVATTILGSFAYVKDGDLSVQPDSALFGIKIIFFLIPAIASLAGLVFIGFFPLDGDKFEELEVKLAEMHKRKRERLTTS